MYTKQPTATAFTRTQESWATFVLGKIRANIEKVEEELRRDNVPLEEWDDNEDLLDLYQEELFYERYAEEMLNQRQYLAEKYLGG